MRFGFLPFDVVAAMEVYADARRRAGLPPLERRRMIEIAYCKVRLDRELKRAPAKKPPTAMAAPTIQEQLDERLWSPGCTAFWLDPDRWFGVPTAADGKMEPFWMHLNKRPKKAGPLSNTAAEFWHFGAKTWNA